MSISNGLDHALPQIHKDGEPMDKRMQRFRLELQEYYADTNEPVKAIAGGFAWVANYRTPEERRRALTDLAHALRVYAGRTYGG